MIITVGFAGIIFGAVLGWYTRDVWAYRPLSKRKAVALDTYWRSWPAMIEKLRDKS
jgi:hypothetical protein|tara:strand:+ start:257 stop:424 length:168 start_codon:yes stop_codon:yes gene_type:complete